MLGFCWVEVKLLGPVQEKVGAGALVARFNCTVVVVQVRTPLTVASALGGVSVWLTTAVAVLVQLLAGLVTVTT